MEFIAIRERKEMLVEDVRLPMAGFAYWRYCCDMRLTYVSRTDDTRQEGKGLTRITDRSCAMLRRNAALNEFNGAVQRNTRVIALQKIYSDL